MDNIAPLSTLFPSVVIIPDFRISEISILARVIYGVYSGTNTANLNNAIYWSSTERGDDDAWGQNFGNSGSEYSNTESYTTNVRAVRSF